MNILVFDSGMGGLSVYQEVRQRLPQHRYDYVFDNAYFPYGEQPESVIIQRCSELIGTLVAERHIDMVIIACNTASTIVLPYLREQLSIPVVGVVPAIKPAAKASKNHHIALLATPGTVQRAYTSELIDQFAAGCQVYKLGVTELVVQAERKMAGYPVDLDEIANAIAPLHALPVLPDVIILGCTHFPLLKDELQQLLPDVFLVDSGAAIARRVASLLPVSAVTGEQGEHGIAFCARADADSYKKAKILIEYGFAELKSLQ